MDAKKEEVLANSGPPLDRIKEEKSSSPAAQAEGGNKDEEEYEDSDPQKRNAAEGGQQDGGGHMDGAGVTENTQQKYMQLQEAVGFLQDIGE